MGSNTSTRRRRALATIVVAALLGLGSFVLPASLSADADTCAKASVNGIGAGSCHKPPCPSGHHGTWGSDTIGPVSYEYVVCIQLLSTSG